MWVDYEEGGLWGRWIMGRVDYGRVTYGEGRLWG